MFDNKKIILIGLLLTIIGCILSAKIPNDSESNQTELLLTNHDTNDTEGFSRFLLELQSSFNDTKNWFKEKCRKTTGNDTAYENLRYAAYALFGYEIAIFVETLIEQPGVKLLNSDSVSEENLRFLFKSSCEKREVEYGYLKKFFDKLEVCAAPDEIQFPKLLFGLSKNVKDFFCEENGKQFNWIRDENNVQSGKNCIDNYDEEIWSCLKNISSTEHAVEDIVSNKIFPSTEKVCRKMTRLENCLMGAINKCNSSSLTEFFKALTTSIRKNTACDNLIESNHESNNIDATVNKV